MSIISLLFLFAWASEAKHIIFRLDDVQAWFLSTESQAIINTFVDNEVALSIGVIGGKFYGDDPNIHKVVTNAWENHGFEVFNHGDDGTTLFNQISKDDAMQHLKDAEETPFVDDYQTFVPHENRWAQSTLDALFELGYRTISASTGGAFPMKVDLKGKILQMPQSTQTADFNGGNWRSTIADVVGDCETAIAKDDFCVVMMHPQEFKSGAVSVADLEKLLADVSAKGWKSITFNNYAKLQGGDVSPVTKPTNKPTNRKANDATDKPTGDLGKAFRTNVDLTMYWVSFEEDFPNSGKTSTIEDCSGNVMAKVHPDFWTSAQLEGTGILADGRVFNLGARNDCFMWLDAKETPYGINHHGWGLVPYVSLAANWDDHGLPAGSKVYVPALKGMKLPNTGGKTHNGCFRVDDRAWSFADNADHIDWFVAKKRAWKEMANTCHGKTCQGNKIDVFVKEDCELLVYLPGSVITEVPGGDSSDGPIDEGCAELWTQCGGSVKEGGKYKGPTCCQQGKCMVEHEHWSQCRTGACPEDWDCTAPTPKPTFKDGAKLPNGAKQSVIFRLDDVQDFFLSANVKEIIGAFQARKLPLSIGVIGANFYGEDPSLHKVIVDSVENHGSDVFNHGDDASTLFNTATKAEAKKHIQNGEEAPFKTYKAFVPHQNRWNEATLDALRELDYSVVSASKGGSFPMKVDLSSKLKLMPQHTETAEFAGGAWKSTIDSTFSDCKNAINVDGFCVVMMHPQEFEKKTVTIAELATLLDQIMDETDWDITTFRAFAKSVDRDHSKPTNEPTPRPTEENQYYPDWSKGACVNDGNQAEWQAMSTSLSACCSEHFKWKEDACKGGAGPEPTPAPTFANIKTPAPTTKDTLVNDIKDLYKDFCGTLTEKKACKKPCSWKKEKCSPKKLNKVKCKKLPAKGSVICGLLGCDLNKKKTKCTGNVKWE